MKETKKNYGIKNAVRELAECCKYFIKNKSFIISLVVVTILGYGFVITHISIGIDDLCMDRYVDGTYILSANRWGNWLIYNILGIHDFTPFWLEFVTTIILFVTAICLCAMIKSIAKDKINDFAYTIFACVFVSAPILFYQYTIQTTNMSVALCNLALLITSYLTYKNYFNHGRFKNYIIYGVISSIFIAMYESNVQTYIVWTFTLLLIHLKYEDSTIKYREIVKCGLRCVLVLAIGIIIYLAVGQVVKCYLNYQGTLVDNFAYHTFIWEDDNPLQTTIFKLEFFTEYDEVNYIFIVLKYFTLVYILIELIESIRKRTLKNIFLSFGILLSNLILFCMIDIVLYRMLYSWAILIAFEILYIYTYTTGVLNEIEEKDSSAKYLKKVISIICVFIVIIQTRTLSNMFYLDYRIAENSKKIATLIGNTIISECEDYKDKPVVYFFDETSGNYNMGLEILLWGYNSFYENGVETTKYINYFGYDISNAEQDVYDNELYLEDYENSKKINNFVSEGEKYIYVTLEYDCINE